MMLLQRKYFLTVTVLSLIILIAVTINYRIIDHIVDKTIADQQEDIAVKAADTVEIWLAQQMKILIATTNSVPLDRIDQNEDTLKPLKMAMKAGHFTDVYIGRKNDGLLIDGADWVPPGDYDPRSRPWYQRAIEVGSISFTTPYIDLVTNKLVIALVNPLVFNGKIIGVMGADTILDTLVENVLNLKVGETGYAFIVQRNGTILVHHNQDYVMRAKIQDIEKDLQGKLDNFRSKDIGSVSYRAKSLQDYVLSYSLIDNSDWFLCVAAPRDEIYSLSRNTTMIFATEVAVKVLGMLALMALLVVGLSGLTLFFYSKKYSSAVQQHQLELTGISKDLEWNITKRKEVETYYETLFNVANDAFLISIAGKFTECNQKTLEMFGLPKDDILEKNMLDLSPVHQPDGVLSEERLKIIIATSVKGEQQIVRWSFVRSDGVEFPASVSLKTFRRNSEKLTLYSIRDISKRVDAEMQLMQAHKMAAAGEMLAAIAHQWRQPLNTLSTYISSLKPAYLNNMLTKNFIEKLVTGADGQIQFMSKTIDDFRNFFKPSKSKGPVDVLKAIYNAVKLMEAQIKHADIQLLFRNTTETESLIVYGYHGEFIHVLVNILVNAKDAIMEHASNCGYGKPQKRIEIVASVENDTVFIHINDTGHGIPEDRMLRIFTPYFTTKGATSGSGMGLYMSKMIVEKEMNGELYAENTDIGARFTIKLKKMIAEKLDDNLKDEELSDTSC